MIYKQLCKPDAHDNYYLGGGAKYTPAILKGGEEFIHKDHGVMLARGRGDLQDRWFLSLESGVVFDGTDIVYFPSPQAALMHLNKMLAAVEGAKQ